MFCEDAGVFCRRNRVGDPDSDLFAGHFNHCNLLCAYFDHGAGDCKIYLRRRVMQIVVVKPPKFIRGILKRIFKIHSVE